MKSITPQNPSRTLAVHQDEYENLAIIDEPVDLAGRQVNCMHSFWKPSHEELEILNNGGYITLGILGSVWPPVKLYADCKERVLGPCDHDWQFVNSSYVHEYGCEQIFYEQCAKCNATREWECE